MKYIEKITLKNFQSHKHTVLKFDNGLNIIVGPSDSGKTSILRAIKWVLYNEPLGDYFIREGESNCSVTIEFNNGVKIERYRDKSKNQYNIYIGDEVETFEGFGNGVPLEVAEAMGINKLELDNKETRGINLAEQLDGPFLISEKPSIKASSIGRLVGANIVDDALKESLKDNRNLVIKKNSLIEENKLLEEELDGFKYLENLEKNVENLENISREIKYKEENKKYLTIRYSNYIGAKENIERNRKVLQKLDGLKNLENWVSKIEFGLFKYNNLNKINIKLKKVLEDKEYQKEIIEKTKEIDLTKDYIDRLSNYISQYQKINFQKEKISRFKIDRKIINDRIDSLRSMESVNIEDLKIKNDLLNKILKVDELYRNNQKNIKIGKSFISKLDGIDSSVGFVDRLEEKSKEKNILESIIIKYRENQNGIGKGNKYLKENNEYIIKLLNEYKKELANKELCPLCFTELNKEHIDKIINTFMEDFNI